MAFLEINQEHKTELKRELEGAETTPVIRGVAFIVGETSAVIPEEAKKNNES